MEYKCNLGGTPNCVASEAECPHCAGNGKVICPNCTSDDVLQQAQAVATITHRVNEKNESTPKVVSYEVTNHLFYECECCSHRWGA